MGKAQNQAFFEKYAPMAMEQQQKYGIPASVTLAQCAIESSWGKSSCALEDKNMFGIHATNGWVNSGKPYTVRNDMGMVKFCKYNTVAESFEHHSRFLHENQRYGKCFNYASDDHRSWAYGICQAGYAYRPPENPDRYAKTIEDIIRQNGLDKYDRMAIEAANQQGITIGYMRGTSHEFTPTTGQAAVFASSGWSFPLKSETLVVTSGFGNRTAPTAGASHNHNGYDLRANFEPILATENNGKVIAVGSDAKSGNYIRVEYARSDGSKIQVSYAHLSKIDVEKGDTVYAGQEIGQSGQSGLAAQTAPHLHFVVRSVDATGQSSYLNPGEYLAELSLRGNISTPVVMKGSGKDVIAEYKSLLNIENLVPVPETDLAHTLPSSNTLSSSEFSDSEALTLAELTNSDNPSTWLKYLATQNGDFGLGSSGDILADIAGLLFSGLATLSMLYSADTSKDEKEDENEQLLQETEEDKYRHVIQRRNEGVNPTHARSLAAMNFDAEYPEEQQGQSLRLS